MDRYYNEAELGELQRMVEDLQVQNQILRLERVLSGFEKDLGKTSAYLLMTGKYPND